MASDAGREPDPRFTFANERTFLAWNRTALALVAGSLVIGQVVEFRSETTRLLTELSPLVLACWVPLASYRRWQANQHALRLGQPLPPSNLPMALALGTSVMAVLVAVLVIIDQSG